MNRRKEEDDALLDEGKQQEAREEKHWGIKGRGGQCA